MEKIVILQSIGIIVMPTRISADVGDHPCFLTFY